MTVYTGTSATDNFGPGDGDDVFNFTVANLVNGDTLTGGSGNDTLVFTDAGEITKLVFHYVTGIDQINLADGSNYLQMADGLVSSSDNHYLVVHGGSGNDIFSTVDVTSGTVEIFAGGGADTVDGPTAGSSATVIAQFGAGSLTSADTINGIGGTLYLYISTPGTMDATAFAHVSGLTSFDIFGNGTNNIALPDALVASAASQFLSITSHGASDDTFDVTQVTTAASLLTIQGGDGNDVFRFTAANLSNLRTITGGAGNDTLAFTTAGTIAAAAFANITGIDAIQLADGTNDVTLTTAMATSVESTGFLTVNGGTGDDRVDASGVTSGLISVFAGSGADTVIGANAGVAGVYANFNAADLTSADTVEGLGGGLVLSILTPGTLGPSAFTHVNGISQIYLQGAGANSVTLSDAVVSNAFHQNLVVVGAFDGSNTFDVTQVTTATNIWSLNGGNGADTFKMTVAELTPTNRIVDGGNGSAIDTLQFTTAGTVAASVFANYHVQYIEQIVLANGTNNISLANALVETSDNNRLLTVIGGTGDDTINASLVTTTANRVFFVSGSGNDTLTGGLGADVFTFAASDLSSGDHVNGGTGSSAAQADRLTFTTAGTIAAGAFANVSHIETITLGSGTNNIALTDALVGSADDAHVLAVLGGGNDTIDASAVTTFGNIVAFNSGAGNDTLTGGVSTDQFFFAAADLTSGDTVNGGAGVDTIQFLTAGSIAASAFANVTHVEQILLANGTNTVSLNNAMVGASDLTHLIAIVGGTGNDAISASGVTTTANRVYFVSGSGNDLLIGGLGSDTFNFAAADLTNFDTVNGGGGSFGDRLTFTTAGTVTAAALGNVSHIEAISLAAGGNSIALNDALVGSSDVNSLVTVNGAGGDDTIDASGVTSAANTVNIVSGAGNDTLTGGAAADNIFFAAADLTSGDTVNGGGGLDTLLFSTAGTIAAGAFANVSHIEQILLANGTNAISLSNALVGASDSNHVLVMTGGSGADTIDASAVTTAANRVVFTGGGGVDVMTAGAGGDIFVYAAAADSTGTAFDTISGMNFASDRFDTPGLAGTVTLVEGLRGGDVNSGNFTGDITAAFAGLAGHHAGLITASGGNLSGQTYLVVDLDGTAGYTAGADLVIHMTSSTGTLVAGNFV